MSEETRKAAVFSCEYSEQNPVYCQQCGGHEHLCRKRLNAEGLTAYFDQMATDGRVETTVQWLVEVSLLIQSDVEKRLKHDRAAQMTAHRAVGNQEQDADNGKLAGYCLVCQIPWPCEYAEQPLGNTVAIRMATQKLFERQHSLWKTHWEMAQPRGVSVMTVHACDVCEEINLFHEELAELKAALEGK